MTLFTVFLQGGTGFASCGVELHARESRPVMQVWFILQFCRISLRVQKLSSLLSQNLIFFFFSLNVSTTISEFSMINLKTKQNKIKKNLLIISRWFFPEIRVTLTPLDFFFFFKGHRSNLRPLLWTLKGTKLLFLQHITFEEYGSLHCKIAVVKL